MPFLHRQKIAGFHHCTRAVPWTHLRKWLAYKTNSFPLMHGKYDRASLV